MRLKSMLVFLILLLNFSIIYSARAQQEKMVFAIDFIRHGDRTSIITLPKAPHHWAEGRGQLTAQGMSQAYQLGMALRQRYVEKNTLLPPYYDPHTLYVRSTDYDRTLMTAQSVLMGLYPLGTGYTLPNKKPALPEGYQPIPIHTVARAHEDLFNTPIPSPLRNRYIYTRTDWKQKTAELQTQFAHWSDLTGVTITNLDTLGSVGDTLHVFQLHHIALPKGMTDEDAKQIIDGGDWAEVTTFKPQEIGEVTGKKLLMAIANDLQQASEQSSELKYILYSAHDGTLLSIMSAMHVPLNETPPYTADLNFGLYAIGSQNYMIKIQYNNQPVYLPVCDNHDCTLSQFINFAKHEA